MFQLILVILKKMQAKLSFIEFPSATKVRICQHYIVHFGLFCCIWVVPSQNTSSKLASETFLECNTILHYQKTMKWSLQDAVAMYDVMVNCCGRCNLPFLIFTSFPSYKGFRKVRKVAKQLLKHNLLNIHFSVSLSSWLQHTAVMPPVVHYHRVSQLWCLKYTGQHMCRILFLSNPDDASLHHRKLQFSYCGRK